METAIGAIDASVPLNAVLLVLSGLHLADGALAQHAAAGEKTSAETPGRKGAEATHAWLLGHLAPLKAEAKNHNAWSYASSGDLKEAVLQAASDLDFATLLAVECGLWADSGRVHRYGDVMTTVGLSVPSPGLSDMALVSPRCRAYLQGTLVLAASVSKA